MELINSQLPDDDLAERASAQELLPDLPLDGAGALPTHWDVFGGGR